MTKRYYIPTRALTIKLEPEQPCGETSHANCVTNRQWAHAECRAQNEKRGREVFTVAEDGEHIWVELKDKRSIIWR